ncbi:MAG: AgmX/PglI C-terminal domain-containing protein, partial [Myxococcaceae bacterium]
LAPPPPVEELSHDAPTRTTQIPAELLAAAQGPDRVQRAAPSRLPKPAARVKRPSPPKLGPGGKGKPRLYLELYWGNIRKEARSFGPIAPKKPVTAAASDKAQLPLYGFSLPEEEFILAESEGDAFKLFLPPGATVETQGSRAPQADGNRRFLTLTKGSSAVLSEGEMSLVAYVAPPPEKFFVNPLKGMPWLALSTFVLLVSGFVSLLVFMPKPSEMPDFQASNLPPVAVKLIAPEPKKKEEAKKKVEAIKEKAKKAVPKKEAPKVAKKEEPTPPPAKPEKAPPPETKALKALAKLSAAGPATNDVLAAIDKMGNGPGSKNAKNNFKLSGLVGKDPIANAGLGTFGLGGGGKGGRATKGLEMLNGRGSGGIGALGASGFGRGGKVGGTVARASARRIAVQGTIDREAVAKTVNSHLQEVRACYERALLKEPGLAGKVVLEWNISTGGTVVSARTKSSTLRNGEVEGCILRSLKTWKFPPAKGGVVIVSYPFLFNSVGY